MVESKVQSLVSIQNTHNRFTTAEMGPCSLPGEGGFVSAKMMMRQGLSWEEEAERHPEKGNC